MKDLQKLVGNLNKSGALSGFLGGVAGGGLTSLMGGKSKKSSKKATLLVFVADSNGWSCCGFRICD